MEAELVGSDDIISDILWTRYFLKTKVYDSFKTVIAQDNKRVILLEKMGSIETGTKRNI